METFVFNLSNKTKYPIIVGGRNVSSYSCGNYCNDAIALVLEINGYSIRALPKEELKLDLKFFTDISPGDEEP